MRMAGLLCGSSCRRLLAWGTGRAGKEEGTGGWGLCTDTCIYYCNGINLIGYWNGVVEKKGQAGGGTDAIPAARGKLQPRLV
jgi:hypothetical protein